MSLLSWTFLSEIAPVGTCPQLPACRNGMNMAGMFSLPSVRGQNLSASINSIAPKVSNCKGHCTVTYELGFQSFSFCMFLPFGLPRCHPGGMNQVRVSKGQGI